MKKIFTTALLAMCLTIPAWAAGTKGDVDGNGSVDVSDVANLIDNLLSGRTSANGDVNGDGAVDVSDVAELLDYLLNGSWSGGDTGTYTVNGVTFTMVPVEGGTFSMGGTAEQGSEAYDDERPVHQVTVSSFAIGQTEVTQELWVAVMGSNPSYFWGRMQCPVEYVNFDDCQTFIAKLNQMTGKHFRLPTEAEWEFAARGGNMSQHYKYAGGNNLDAVAWYWDNIPSRTSETAGYGTQPVATKAPNELGLYDMSGNVQEFCSDWFTYYTSDAQVDPQGPATGSTHVTRGGAWNDRATFCRVSVRFQGMPSSRGSGKGLRLAM